MAAVKTVKIDGEMVHVFQSAIYIFESGTSTTLELDLIVSEVVIKKYKNERTLITEIELEDGQILSSIMNLKILSGRLPQMSLFVELDDREEYRDIQRVSENDSLFPELGDGITIEEIRKVEMPNERVTLKLSLPIDQVEWLNAQKGKVLNDIIRELIYEYWEK